MVCGRGSGRSQLKSVSGADRVRLCGHVKLSFLNSADYQEYLGRKVWPVQGLRYKLCLLRALSSSILPFKRFGLNLFLKKTCSGMTPFRENADPSALQRQGALWT